MVSGKPAQLSGSRLPGRAAWRPLADGAWHFRGSEFADLRGSSFELLDLSRAPDPIAGFTTVQENFVVTREQGCARGLHYQVAPYGQEKLVSVIDGVAQFFWISLAQAADKSPQVQSLVLRRGSGTLYTPADCAHGFLAMAAETIFVMKMSAPVMPDFRGELSFMAPDLVVTPEIPINLQTLSDRDRHAPGWKGRRRSRP